MCNIRTSDRPLTENLICNVLCLQGHHILLRLGHCLLVLLKANVPEFSLYHAWSDLCHTNRSVHQIVADSLRESIHCELRCIVQGTIGVCVNSGGGQRNVLDY
jgi:hypothetical protein